MPSKRKEQPQRIPHCYLACVFTSVVLAGLVLVRGWGLGNGRISYGVMFDAGSTGSRVHVYRFAPNGRLIDEVFEEVKPGLSGHHHDGKSPEQVVESLVPLLTIAVDNVPKDQQHCTPIALRATAGLRQLGPGQADDILAAVGQLFAKYPFAMASDSVAILGGMEEGIFAWVTVNYLLDNLGSHNTATIMDMGGASTQVVFQPAGAVSGLVPEEMKHVIGHHDKEHVLYGNSYDRFGLMRAREKIVLAAPTREEHPCMPSAYSHSFKIEGTEYTVKNPNGGSFAKCHAVAKSILNLSKCAKDAEHCSFNGVFQPNLQDKAVFNGPIYAFSYFFDRTQVDGPRPQMSVGEIKAMGEKACLVTEVDPQHGLQCMDLSYLYSILHDGYHLPDTTTVNIAKKIDGVETAWTLGAILHMKESLPSCS